MGVPIRSPRKSETGRRVVSPPGFMMDEMSTHIAEHAEPGPGGRLFQGANGGPLRRAVLRRAWDEAGAKVGMRHLPFHDLRHTGNTLAASTAVSTNELMARMGHSNSDAALRYQQAPRERDMTMRRGSGAWSKARFSNENPPPRPMTRRSLVGRQPSLKDRTSRLSRSTGRLEREPWRTGCAMNAHGGRFR